MNAAISNFDFSLCGVYKIECTTNGFFYIGSTRTRFRDRYLMHIRRLRSGKHHSPIMQSCYSKYGDGSFIFSIVEVCEPDEAYDREQYFMDLLSPSMNIREIAKPSTPVCKHVGMSQWYFRKNQELITILASNGLLSAFCKWEGAVRTFFGLEPPSKMGEDFRISVSHPKKSKENYKKPKSQGHRDAISMARKKYVERMKASGEWPPLYYKKRNRPVASAA